MSDLSEQKNTAGTSVAEKDHINDIIIKTYILLGEAIGAKKCYQLREDINLVREIIYNASLEARKKYSEILEIVGRGDSSECIEVFTTMEKIQRILNKIDEDIEFFATEKREREEDILELSRQSADDEY
jgi:hypothetical protein